MTSDRRASVAILIVNGRRDPPWGHWLELCLERLVQHTAWPDWGVFVWNNNVGAEWVESAVSRLPNATLIEADPDEVLAHRHAVPLQRLYERALAEGYAHIVALDSDAHPIRGGWLSELVGGLEDGSALAGVWLDELKRGMRPYVHPSCLATSVSFVERHRLRFDFIAPASKRIRHDTLSTFTDTAIEQGLPIRRLERSNANQWHRVLGGIYGDTIYHHGAGSRPAIQFWGERPSKHTRRQNTAIRDSLAELLFNHYDRYVGWLRGIDRPELLLVLGMHRSGTSCLTGALEACGLSLGDVSRYNLHNPRGNLEIREVSRLHESILVRSGGSWHDPPRSIELGPGDRAALRRSVDGLVAQAPAGIKDPRLLLLADRWAEVAPRASLVGTFRHPMAVASSLGKRDGMSVRKATALWLTYNQRLVELHRKSSFPLIEFDPSDHDVYCSLVATAALTFGLHPNLDGIRSFVKPSLAAPVREDTPIPPACRETYDYLLDNKLRLDAHRDSFAARMLEMASPVERGFDLKTELAGSIAELRRRFPQALAIRIRRRLPPKLRRLLSNLVRAASGDRIPKSRGF
jgi:hypothetical protein